MSYKINYNFWYNALRGTSMQAEMDKIGADEKLKEDSFYRTLEFGTAGMRGIIGLGTNRINIFNVRKCTQGLANYIIQKGKQNRGVAIAYDSRLYSDVFALESALILCKNGIKVYLYDTLHSVPQLSYTILKLNCFSGIVITASHNPPQYNGYKMYGEDGGQLGVEDAATVTEFIEAISDVFALKGMDKEEAINSGLLTFIGEEMDRRYYDDVKTLVMNKEVIARQADKLNVVYTPLHGSGNVPVRTILKEIGLKNVHVVKEQEMPDSAFPTIKVPNPEEAESFVLAGELAKKVGANLMFATDPDCDRLGVCVADKDGVFHALSGNQIGCLLMDYVLSQKKDKLQKGDFVVKSIVSSTMADVIAAHYGVEIRSVLTGFKFIAEQIKLSLEEGNSRFLFGYEESYGYLSGTFVRDKDACIASMLVVEAACYYADKGMTLYDALAQMYEKYGFFKEKVISKTLRGIEGIAKIQNAMVTLREKSPKKIGAFDVIAIRDYKTLKRHDFINDEITDIDLQSSDVLFFELDNASFILRPSGTEPKLKAYVTVRGKTDEDGERIFKILLDEVTNLMDTLTR